MNTQFKSKIEYAKDNRTKEQFESDFKYGIKAQNLIIERLKEYFWIDSTQEDKFGEIKAYSEDCTIGYGDMNWKIEIKFTKTHLDKWIQLKQNQIDKAKEQNIFTLFISDKRIAWINPNKHLKLIEDGYCNKPCYLFTVKQWYNNFTELKEYLLG